jgi:D-aspartate ligase
MGNMPTKIKQLIPAVVLTSHTMGLGVIRALGKMGVPIIVFYYEKIDFGYLSKYVQGKSFVANPERNEDEFINQIIINAPKNGRSLLIPVDDATVLTVSKYKSVLEKHYIVACTEFEVTKLFINKKNTYELAEKIGVPAPKTRNPKSVHDLNNYADMIKFPCLVKPYYSHKYVEIFKRKMDVVNNIEQMKSAYKRATAKGIDVMIQELIPGDDCNGFNYNSYFLNGETLLEFAAEKVRLSPTSYGVPCVVKSCSTNNEIRIFAQRLLKAMGFYGYSCIEFKKDARDGIYKLMELNGRFNRSGLLSTKCGLNFPWLMYNHLINGIKPNNLNYKSRIFWIDEFKDLALQFCNRSEKRFSLKNFVSPYFKKNIFAVFDISDPLPFLKRCLDLSNKTLKKCFLMAKSVFKPKKELKYE